MYCQPMCEVAVPPTLVLGWEGGHTPSTSLFLVYVLHVSTTLAFEIKPERRPVARDFRWFLEPSRCAATPHSNPWTRPSGFCCRQPVGAAVAVDASEITPRQCCWFLMSSDHHHHRRRRKLSWLPWPQQGVAGMRTAYRSPTSPHADFHRCYSRRHWPESQRLESRARPTAPFRPGKAGCPCSPSFPFGRAMMTSFLLLLRLIVCRWKHDPSCYCPACFGFSCSPLPPPDPGLVLMVGGRDVDGPIRGRPPARVAATSSHRCLLWAYLEPNVSEE